MWGPRADSSQGNECNCGSAAPSGIVYSSPPSPKRGLPTGGECTPCAGNSAECCGAPGGFALVYHITPYVEGSSAVAYNSTDSAGYVFEASFTTYAPISSPSFLAYTSTGSGGFVAVGSSTSYDAVASVSTFTYIPTSSVGSASVTTTAYSVPSASASTGSGSESISSSDTSSSGSSVGADSSSSPASSSTYYFNYTSPITSTSTKSGSAVTQGASTTVAGNAVGTATTVNGGISDGPGTAINGGNDGLSATSNGGNVGAASTTGNNGNGDEAGAGGGTIATNGGTTPTSNGGGGPEPTLTSAPSCSKSSGYASNNTKYIDYFGYTYDIRCNLDLQSTPADHAAYAEDFEDCLEYCSLLTDCVAVTYQDPPNPPNNLSNCYPKWTFGGYKPSVEDGLYSGVNVNGPSPGTLENQNLCTADNTQGQSYAGTTYYDDFGTAWTIGCDTQLAVSSATALSATVADTLASCVDYCSRYDSCAMVNWTGPHANGTLSDPNCFPASSIGVAGAAGSAPGSGYASLNPF